jgi:hypothetical protein
MKDTKDHKGFVDPVYFAFMSGPALSEGEAWLSSSPLRFIGRARFNSVKAG